ncbi:MAG: hypothetical protein QOI15_2752 [Pseudonocardiales bacterium]|jgi:plastocyanin|nr:hypothetical protein [Pseudonocardiales bacterium]
MRLSAALLAIAVSILGLLVGLSPASAATHQVSIVDFAFTPAAMTVGQGDTVTWTYTQGDANHGHTVTSDQGFWSSPTLALNQTYSQAGAFKNAGAYAYHCSIHHSMTGVIRVPLGASGSSSGGWTLRWSSLSGRPTSRNFDVQIKRPGSSRWAMFRSAVTTLSAPFNPSANGTYRFQARTRIVSNGRVSGWSPVRKLAIS